MDLAAYATDYKKTRGRVYQEARADFRTPFQRDRDRIIHSTAFRRLMHKTQVFVVHEGDLYRTRLTHTIEVAQVARTLARKLALDEDLAETIALAHDLGHPPFGHTGEEVLKEKMLSFGGFDHNAQSLRLISKLEKRYLEFDGLNLTWESLEGIAKHNGPLSGALPWALLPLNDEIDLELDQSASAEAQTAAIADDIAYNHHDLQDGLRSGLLSDDQIMQVPILAECYELMRERYPEASGKEFRYGALSHLFSLMVYDVIEESTSRLANLEPTCVEDIRAADHAVIAFSSQMKSKIDELRRFLFINLYRHDSVVEMRKIAQTMTAKTFDYLMEKPDEIPQSWREGRDLDDTSRARIVCDYISGMTDRYLGQKWQHAHGQNLTLKIS